MTHRTRSTSVLIVAALLLAAGGRATAATCPEGCNDEQEKCSATVGKAAGKFLKSYLKQRAKYSRKQLKDESGDAAKRDERIAKAELKLRAALDKKCGASVFGVVPAALKKIGFPGKCGDDNVSNGFTISDLQDCIFETHKVQADRLHDLDFGVNGADGASALPGAPANLGKCQKQIFRNAQKFVRTIQKEVSRCRDGLVKGSLSGFLPTACADNDVYPRPREKIAMAESKLRAKITNTCTDAQIATLDVCDTCDPGSCPAQTVPQAVDCIVATHRNATDDPDNSGLATPFGGDFIDIEYAEGATCGDNIVNDPLLAVLGSEHRGTYPEECDGIDDDACPDLCGDPTGNFSCLCTDIPRERAIEHENADLDNGWTGTSHDSGIVEGGGYVVDLYDCDGPGGGDPECIVGPNCALAPALPCSNDAQCGFVGPCRKRATAVGPHCNENIQQTCTGDGDCNNSSEDFCRKIAHGAPLPLSSGGVAVCVENVFSEDIVGTTNLDTGSSAIRLRQNSITRLASGTINQPCPSCGGFCDALLPAQSTGPGGRTLCQSDADCPPGVACITEAICSFGLNQDQPCRRVPPFGSPTDLFGTPSVDCIPVANQLNLGTIDILFNPATTGTVTVTPSYPCNAPGFGGKKCILGSDTGDDCTVDTDCTGGGAGSCRDQCFCPAIGGTAEQPNPCFAACRGGGSDLLPCAADSDCSGGFCQQASCRMNPADTGSAQEGYCPAGPVVGTCSFSNIKTCVSDADCKRPTCPFCKIDDSEICIFTEKNCFVNEQIVRVGTPGTPDRVAASQFCITATGSSAVNSTAGLPGPGALTQPATTEVTGF